MLLRSHQNTLRSNESRFLYLFFPYAEASFYKAICATLINIIKEGGLINGEFKVVMHSLDTNNCAQKQTGWGGEPPQASGWLEMSLSSTHTHTHTHSQAYTHLHTHTYIHTYTYTHAIRAHTHTPTSKSHVWFRGLWHRFITHYWEIIHLSEPDETI